MSAPRYHLDSNILVRFFTGESEAMFKAADSRTSPALNPRIDNLLEARLTISDVLVGPPETAGHRADEFPVREHFMPVVRPAEYTAKSTAHLCGGWENFDPFGAPIRSVC